MESPERILIRGVNWLGDAIMTTPALLRLREAKPKASLTLLTLKKLEDLWRHHPAVDEVLSVSPRETLGQVARRLRAGQFQTALILPNSIRSALETWWAGIPQRIGYARPLRKWFLTQVVAAPPGLAPMRKRSLSEIRLALKNNQPSVDFPASSHQLFHYLRLVQTLGATSTPLAPQISVTPEETLAVTDKFELSSGNAQSPPLLGLNAGAEYGPAKRWPIERFIATAIKIQQQIPCRWLVLGGPGDLDLANQVCTAIHQAGPHASKPEPGSSRIKVIHLAGKTTLRELCAVLKACRLLLTNDTGPMHVAAAVGTSVIVPFGSTSPALTGPGLPGDTRHRLIRSAAPCAPCFQRTCPLDFRCMLGLEVDQVVSAIFSTLSSTTGE